MLCRLRLWALCRRPAPQTANWTAPVVGGKGYRFANDRSDSIGLQHLNGKRNGRLLADNYSARRRSQQAQRGRGRCITECLGHDGLCRRSSGLRLSHQPRERC